MCPSYFKVEPIVTRDIAFQCSMVTYIVCNRQLNVFIDYNVSHTFYDVRAKTRVYIIINASTVIES